MQTNETIIQFDDVSKQFHRGPLLLKEALMDLITRRKADDFWALRDVSFRIERGESVGILGPNGSGKSTLLKHIAGVMYPTAGEVSVQGRIAPLIELGAGFHPELIGRENIYINGSILGLSHAEIEERFDDIVAFAELEEFIESPVKHYSSGMYMRLGFAVAVHVDPEILLVDEILAVGDAVFQKKCFQRIEEFKEQGATIILVTHSPEQLRKHTDRGIYIHQGELQYVGPVDTALEAYHEQQ